MTPVLAAEGVAYAYGERTVLQGFDLAAEPGTVTAVLGPNGAGKSTALRLLSRLLRPGAGRVTLAGRDVWELPQRSFAREVAFLPQSEAAAWPMTVEQVVLLGRAPHRGWLRPYTREDREALGDALRQVDLEDMRARDLDSLSGGERRRALLARALAQNARVLLLDEPGAHLDLRHQMELFQLLGRLAHGCGAAIVLSLHDLNLASLFADVAVLLSEGRILAQGPCQEVLTPDRIHRAFGVVVEMVPHPGSGVSMILPVPTAPPSGSSEERPA